MDNLESLEFDFYPDTSAESAFPRRVRNINIRASREAEVFRDNLFLFKVLDALPDRGIVQNLQVRGTPKPVPFYHLREADPVEAKRYITSRLPEWIRSGKFDNVLSLTIIDGTSHYYATEHVHPHNLLSCFPSLRTLEVGSESAGGGAYCQFMLVVRCALMCMHEVHIKARDGEVFRSIVRRLDQPDNELYDSFWQSSLRKITLSCHMNPLSPAEVRRFQSMAKDKGCRFDFPVFTPSNHRRSLE
jgi:hypothetical protein